MRQIIIIIGLRVSAAGVQCDMSSLGALTVFWCVMRRLMEDNTPHNKSPPAIILDKSDVEACKYIICDLENTVFMNFAAT